MSDDDLLEPFHLAVIRSVANESNVPEPELREALEAHQQTMRDSPGVEDLVYEWRKQYDDPILERRPETFFVAVPPTVWEEFGAYLDLEEDLLAALVATHQEQTVRTSGVTLDGLTDGHVPLVVTR
ncbi:hypothetical protein [Haloarcula pelagica]|uniref:hypothetical protein n=2 Tax=Haloarcula TaxID=2237 RepID=UPI0024C45277|nr:hypothetical protein [Halomicroarcula sp. YJ-61-S]